MIDDGGPAPALTLRSDSGESVPLSQFRGSPLVHYFHPKDRLAASRRQ